MEFKLYKCRICGNVAYKVVDSGVQLVCCGEDMSELEANTTDGAVEKHVPVVAEKDGIADIAVGSVTHPMEEKHYIMFIAAQSEDTVTIKRLRPGGQPVLKVLAGEGVKAYELCNLHGYWKGEKDNG